MPIQFPCSGCGKAMRAPDGSQGRQARCPLCGTTQTIPPAEKDDDIFPSISPERAISPPVAHAPPAPVHPGETEVPSAVAPPRPGTSMPGESLKAIMYGVSNFRSTVLMALMAGGLYLMFNLIASFTFCAGAIIMAVGNLMIGGFFLRFYLDAVISSLEGLDLAPDLPPVNFRMMFLNGLKGLGILFVYVYPIVTIPLLPLGLLGLAYSDDIRAFDLIWAIRVGIKKPGQLLILWAILLLWVAAMLGVCILLLMLLGLVVGAVASTGCLGWALGILIAATGAIMIAGVCVMFTTMGFRCVGMLGRYNPDLLEMIPESGETIRPILFILAGVLVSLLALYLVAYPAVRALREIAAG